MDKMTKPSNNNEVSIKPNENTKHMIKSGERIPAIKRWIKNTFTSYEQVIS